MIGRLHAWAGQIIVLGTVLLLTLTAAAQAAKVSYVTTPEMHKFVVVTGLSWTGVILSGLAVVFALVTRSRDSEMRAAIKANTEALTVLAEMYKEHHLDPDAHPAGSRARIGPVMEKLEALAEGQETINRKLERLYAEHRVIRKTELCMMNAANLTARRDPALSPSPRRKDDPEDFNAAALDLRGKTPPEDAEDDDEGAP